MTDPRLHRAPRHKVMEFVSEGLNAVIAALLSAICIATLAATI